MKDFKMNFKQNYRNKKYLEYILTLPCEINDHNCSGQIVYHHLRGKQKCGECEGKGAIFPFAYEIHGEPHTICSTCNGTGFLDPQERALELIKNNLKEV